MEVVILILTVSIVVGLISTVVYGIVNVLNQLFK
jgi:hypothetical protein